MKSGTNNVSDPGLSVSECRRCGTCCKKSGPSFHHADRSLIESGKIPARCLYTIRQGEMAYDNVRGRLAPVSSDLIKIREKPGTRACLFFDESESGCTIYENRPQECRALQCWDTRAIETVYAENRLTRKDLLHNVNGLWGLIEGHQDRCDYEAVRRLLAQAESAGGGEALKALYEILRYDEQIRLRVMEKGGPGAEMTDFLFGRPLTETLVPSGVKIRKEGERFCITKSPWS